MASDQQFCLRWNNHQNTLVSIFDSLLESGTLVDCTLAAEGRFLQAHKVVLSACSPYFAMLLREHYDKFPILILKDIKYQELQAMMNYMYRGEVNITQETLGSFLKAAESLQIRGLTDNSHCVENNNGIIRDNNSLHGTGSLYSSSHSNKKLSSDSRKLHGGGGGGGGGGGNGGLAASAGATPLISQQRSRSPPSFVTQTQSSKKYLKSSPAVVENHHHAAAAAAAAAVAAASASVNVNHTSNSKSSSSSDCLENNVTSIKRRKLLPPIKSEGLVVTPINPSSTTSTYNNIDASNVCEVPSQAQSIPAIEGKANVPSPSIPPKIESPHMDITPVISNKVPPITNSTPNSGAALPDGMMKSNKSTINDLVKVKSEQFEDSYNEDTNDDSYTTEDNDNDRDENSHLSMAGLPFHNNQSATNFDSSGDRSLLGPDGNNSLQDSPDTRANDEIVSQFVIKLSKSLPVDYCNGTQQQTQQQHQQQQQQHCSEQQSHAISTTSTFGCQPAVACGSSLAAAMAAASIAPATPPPATSSRVCFPCDACGNVYNYKTSLARHQRFECGKDPQFQCPFCEHRTKHKSSLTTHIDCKHKQELLYEENRAIAAAGGVDASFWREYNGISSSLTKT